MTDFIIGCVAGGLAGALATAWTWRHVTRAQNRTITDLRLLGGQLWGLMHEAYDERDHWHGMAAMALARLGWDLRDVDRLKVTKEPGT